MKTSMKEPRLIYAGNVPVSVGNWNPSSDILNNPVRG